MKWINADQQVTVNIYDDEHEEYFDKIMTVEEMLDTYTADGCPTIYANPEPKTGHWIEEDMFDGDVAYRCSECNELFWIESGTPKDNEYNYCPKCGKRLVEPQESEVSDADGN